MLSIYKVSPCVHCTVVLSIRNRANILQLLGLRIFTTGTKPASMAFTGKICAFVVLAVLAYAVHEVHADMHTGMMHYASVTDGDGNFGLKWTYRNNMLHFKMKCKGLGWCGVGFSTFGTGAGMAQYDIAVGGVAANMTGYLYVSLLTIKTLYFKGDYRMLNQRYERGFSNLVHLSKVSIGC